MTTIVIKIGGGEGIELGPILDEFAALVKAGTRAVLVHGGSHETNVISERLGCPPTFIKSPSGHESRRTDRATLEIFEMVYCGKVNKAIVEHLQRLGVNAVGLSGIDGALWRGSRKGAIRAVDDEGRTTIVRDDLSGRVESADADLLNLLLDSGRTPVLTPPALAVSETEAPVAINVDADRAAAGGRMKNKVLAAEEALAGGVGRVVIGSANGPNGEGSPIARARAGAGTVFEGAGA